MMQPPDLDVGWKLRELIPEIADEKEGKEGETEECEQDKPKKGKEGEAAEEEVDEKEVEEQEDDEKEGETATGRKRKRTDDKQKKRCRRTKAMMQPPDLDVGWKLRELIPELLQQREILDQLIKDDDNVAAHRQRQTVLQIGARILRLPVCPGCFMEVPSTAARNQGSESWRFHNQATWCSFCGKTGLQDFTRTHLEIAHKSLRRRVRGEIEKVLQVLPDSCGDLKALKQKLADLNIVFGVGGGCKAKKKKPKKAWLVSQVGRTMERLLLEPSLRAERLAMLFALRCLEVR